MKYTLICADPPWRYNNVGTRGAAGDHYGTMSRQEICGQPVEGVAADDALLFLWCPPSIILEGTGALVCGAWGFDPKQIVTWVKTTKGSSSPEYVDEVTAFLDDVDLQTRIGTGNYFRAAHETAIVAVRGRATKLIEDRGIPNVIHAPRGPHSAKPEVMQDLLDRLVPGGLRVEFFARRFRPGWACIGNELANGGSIFPTPKCACPVPAWSLQPLPEGEIWYCAICETGVHRQHEEPLLQEVTKSVHGSGLKVIEGGA